MNADNNEWDLGEIYKAMKDHSKEKKSNNLEQSTKLLNEHMIDYESKNNGIHLIVTAFDSEIIDFWPTTGKWIPRGKAPQRGVKNLIRYIKRLS